MPRVDAPVDVGAALASAAKLTAALASAAKLTAALASAAKLTKLALS